MSAWGGARKGAGRKKRSDNVNIIVTAKERSTRAKFGEPSKAMRIPQSMEQLILHYIENKGFNLPVYAMKVPMGPIAESIDHVDRTMNLNDLVQHPGKTYFHPVEGDSMEPTVFAGDLAMIDSALEPMHNDVVLAYVDGGLTLKRLMKQKNRVWLEADNNQYEPILIDPNVENMVCGVMLISIRPVSSNHIKKFT